VTLVRHHGTVSLLWRIFLGNAAVLLVATLVLVVSPATVSFPVAATEAVVLAVGLVVMLAVNYLLLRRAVGPLQRLAGTMRAVDPLAPGRRSELPEASGEVAELAGAFDEMLERIERERRDSARRALAAQEDERRRIARELHDEVGQALTAVVLQLDRAHSGAQGAVAERMREAREAARATLEEVRAIARNLRPEALDDLGLAAAVRQLCADAERSGAVVERRIEPALALAPEAEVVVYRVAQEALTNALRHSGAERIELTLEGAGAGGAELRVADDGRGLDGATEGAGLRGMRERALLAGGLLELGRAPAGGALVRLRVP
jgi:two-component system, NarL family, sensor histidine kinase UhpB